MNEESSNPEELSDEELAAALDNPDPHAAKQGDGGNLELWEDDNAPAS